MRAITFVVGAGLSTLVWGCTAPKTMPPQAAQYGNISLTERIARLTEEVFPYGGIVELGRTREDEAKYAFIRVLWEYGTRTLDVTLYVGSDKEVEAEVIKGIQNKDYENSKKTLEQSTFEVTRFHDSGADSIKPESNDFVIIGDIKAGYVRLPLNDMLSMSKYIERFYNSVLTETESALKALK